MENRNKKNLWKGFLWVIGIITASILYVAFVEHITTTDKERNVASVGLIAFIIFCYYVFARYFLRQEYKEGKDIEEAEE